jgi:predicted lipid-binding transport protein (Tim44 family)
VTDTIRERSLPERILMGMAVLALMVLGFFFLAAALVAGAILAAVVLLRFWWLKRKLRKAAEEEFIATEYTVVEREKLVEPPDAEKRR